MAKTPIKENENFFINGSGTAIVTGAHGKMGLIHLQDMELELGSEMEEIFGGEGNFPVFQYQTQKTASVKFTNASMSLDMINSTQGVTSETDVVLFQNELVIVGADGSLPLTYKDTADLKTLTVYGDNDNIIEADSEGKIDTKYAGKRVGAVYAYTTKTGAIGSSVKTTSVPGYVQIFHKSNPIKQKNGRIVRLYTTIYRARCDGSLTITQEHDGAFAPELNFELVDPERADGKFISFAVKDVTDGEGEEAVEVVDDKDIQKDYEVLPDVDKAADAPVDPEPTPVVKTKLPIPAQAAELTETGSEQSINWNADFDSTKMTAGGTLVGTDAGTYTATVTLKDTENYEWTDGTTEVKNVDWVIASA